MSTKSIHFYEGCVFHLVNFFHLVNQCRMPLVVCVHIKNEKQPIKSSSTKNNETKQYIWIDIHSAPLALQEEYICNGSKHYDCKVKEDPNI